MKNFPSFSAIFNPAKMGGDSFATVAQALANSKVALVPEIQAYSLSDIATTALAQITVEPTVTRHEGHTLVNLGNVSVKMAGNQVTLVGEHGEVSAPEMLQRSFQRSYEAYQNNPRIQFDVPSIERNYHTQVSLKGSSSQGR